MRGRDTVPRRTVVGLVGSTAAAAAGCLGQRDESVDDAGEAELASDEDAGANETPSTDWESIDEIRLETDITVWTGAEPAGIAGESNPTLVLVAGREYAITWENTDGFRHNLELRDGDDAVVDGYATESAATEGATRTLTFEATPAMAAYVCEPHEPTMRGDLEIREA
ncbi:cupredoxin domain-containing protein [Halopiger aswanensis]|uniref:Copper binding plastocyanin/azurin family protein n=1 Tax=Halopiger aswanensis TaxID=148449 RepID=A0A3R7GH63_9EURY|nr:plastocyanin/azurin family copper-binding protein [Halopiger aswanensis]RKD93740.1 copper binding plastocyanin/azurin family protein [Halopiger aswanensis]